MDGVIDCEIEAQRNVWKINWQRQALSWGQRQRKMAIAMRVKGVPSKMLWLNCIWGRKNTRKKGGKRQERTAVGPLELLELPKLSAAQNFSDKVQSMVNYHPFQWVAVAGGVNRATGRKRDSQSCAKNRKKINRECERESGKWNKMLRPSLAKVVQSSNCNGVSDTARTPKNRT